MNELLNIILIEDNPANAVLVRHILDDESLAHTIRHASSLRQATELFEQERPDIVMLDLGLPDSQGLNTLTSWLQHHRHAPVIVLTSLDDDALGRYAVQYGAQDYLVKGEVDGKVLVRTLHHAISRHRYQRNDEAVRLRTIEAELRAEAAETAKSQLEAEIAERRRAEEALMHKVEFEALITRISSAFINLPTEEIGARITATLKDVGNFISADRGYVFMLESPGATYRSSHAWCRDDIETKLCALDGHSGGELAWWTSHLTDLKTLNAGRVDALPPLAQPERDLLSAQGVKSLIAVPLALNGAPTSFLGFDTINTEHHWDDDTVSMIRLLGNILANALERKSAESALQVHQNMMEHLAHHDPLTSLPNRRVLEQSFNDVRFGKTAHPMALLYLDLNRFKNINDTLGHQVGDTLLMQVAARLRNVTREDELVARLGGDEFAILLKHAGESQVREVATRVSQALLPPFTSEGRTFSISASVGAAFYPKDGETFAEILRRTDQAMYRAKHGGGGLCLYDPVAEQKLVQDAWLESALREALDKRQLTLHYQPIVDAHTGTCARAEALARWSHAERGPIGPSEFIAVAEESDLIVELDHWAVEEAIKQAKEGGFDVAVNFSPTTLQHPDTVSHVLSCLDSYDFEARQLTIEVTERVLAQGQETLAALKALRQRGVHLSLDDFGAGYASLSYLKRFPIDTLKVDRSFIHDLQADATVTAIAETVIHLAKELNMNSLAEGVETEAQRMWLKVTGCNLAQGNLLAEPMPYRHLISWLDQESSERRRQVQAVAT